MENDFSNIKIDDKVYHVVYGWGTVMEIATDTFEAKFANYKREWFWFDGKSNRTHPNPSVFWDEVKIVPLPRPKRKVEKTIEGWLNIYPNDTSYKEINARSYDLYKSPELADKNANKEKRIGEACYIIHKYTIEE